MQEFCREYCRVIGVEQTQERLTATTGKQQVIETVFRDAAGGTSRVIFEKLVRGPSKGKGRKQRALKDGSTADIYLLVLKAIANLQPSAEPIEYDAIRSSIRKLVAELPPQANEITRVLEKLSRVVVDEESSVAVIDYDKQARKLYITDPFFAFFLKWGLID